jgi:hypothetical protein
MDIAVQLPMPSFQQIIHELRWRLSRALSEFSFMRVANGPWNNIGLLISEMIRGCWRWIITLSAFCTLLRLLYLYNSSGAPRSSKRRTRTNARSATSQPRDHGAYMRTYGYTTSIYNETGQEKVEVVEMRNAKDKIWTQLAADLKTRAILAARKVGSYRQATG